MNKPQRTGLAILLVTLITVTIVTGRPGLTEGAWFLTNVFAGIMIFIGFVFFVSD